MNGLETSYHLDRGLTLATILLSQSQHGHEQEISHVWEEIRDRRVVSVSLCLFERFLEALLICENLSNIKSSIRGRKIKIFVRLRYF